MTLEQQRRWGVKEEVALRIGVSAMYAGRPVNARPSPSKVLDASCSVVRVDGLDAARAQPLRALLQRLRVGDGELDVRLGHAGTGYHAVANPEVVLGHDLEVVAEEQVVVLVDAGR